MWVYVKVTAIFREAITGRITGLGPLAVISLGSDRFKRSNARILSRQHLGVARDSDNHDNDAAELFT